MAGYGAASASMASLHLCSQLNAFLLHGRNSHNLLLLKNSWRRHHSSITRFNTRVSSSTNRAFATLPELASVNLQQLLNPPLVHEIGSLFGTFVPVALAILVCHKLKIGMGNDIRVAVFRSSAQLILLGFALKFVFEGDPLLMCTVAVLFMVLIAAYTAGERAKQLPRSHLVAALSLALGSVGTLILMILLKALPIKPRYVIPVAGYVVGNSMSMVGSCLNRLHHDIGRHQGQIEVALALGASPRQAVEPYVQRAVAQGMGPWIDSIKTAGLITLPGSMTGMLMGGSSPLEAVEMQIQVLYMLLGAAALSSAMSSYLGWRVLFTHSYQLALGEPSP